MDDGSEVLSAANVTGPLTGIVVCCTSIAVYNRESLALTVQQLGGVHCYDLTPDVTHLLVGHYDTPKYRHVARTRPDVKAMDAAWIDAVRDAWREDVFNFKELEDKYTLNVLETHGLIGNTGALEDRGRLRICISGFDNLKERQVLKELIESKGAYYSPELTKSVTHLITTAPSGRKYEAARNWEITIVSQQWLPACVQRGMILDEKYFDPLIPKELQGKDAYVPSQRAQIKRKRGEVLVEEVKKVRKLRKTASVKLGEQTAAVWDSLLGVAALAPVEAPQDSFAEPVIQDDADKPADQVPPVKAERITTLPALADKPVGIFSKCVFYVSGFNLVQERVVKTTVESQGAVAVDSLEEASTCLGPSNCQRYIIVPQIHPPSAVKKLRKQADSLAVSPIVVTEFFLEACLYIKKLLDPTESIIGRPFPVFPIPEACDMKIHVSGYTGIQLHHTVQAVRQIGAEYHEFMQASITDVLVLKSIRGARKEKVALALKSGIDIVNGDWLFACCETGMMVDRKAYRETALEMRRNSMERKDDYDKQKKTNPKPELKKWVSETALRGGRDGPVFDVEVGKLARAKSDMTETSKENHRAELPKTNPSFLQSVLEDEADDDDELVSTRPLSDPQVQKINESPASMPMELVNSVASAGSHSEANAPADHASSVKSTASSSNNDSSSSSSHQQSATALKRALSAQLLTLLDPSKPKTTEPPKRKPRTIIRTLSRDSVNLPVEEEPMTPPPIIQQEEEEISAPSTQVGVSDPEGARVRRQLLGKLGRVRC